MRNLLTMQHRCSFLRDLFFSLLVLTGLAVPAAVSASPIVYTAFTVADGRLGNWSFRDARVVLTQESDTTQVQTISVPGLGGGSVLISINYGGTASVTITTAQRTVHVRLGVSTLRLSLAATLRRNSQNCPAQNSRRLAVARRHDFRHLRTRASARNFHSHEPRIRKDIHRRPQAFV